MIAQSFGYKVKQFMIYEESSLYKIVKHLKKPEYNPSQNIWHKYTKLNKIGLLINVFTVFFAFLEVLLN